MSANRYDAIVIGGGHNGLVSAAYLAQYGARTLVLEARERTGGASDTMEPWPELPGVKVTTLSYVMSLMPAAIIRDLGLERFGYKIFPMSGTYTPIPGGDFFWRPKDPEGEYDFIAKHSKKDADVIHEYEAWVARSADILGPLLMETPPPVGSTSLADLADQMRFALKMRKGMSQREAANITKLFTMSAADLLDEWFESDVIKGVLSTDGIIGTWAGPEEPGTAYVLMHHSVGDLGDGVVNVWGFPEGGMGAVAGAVRSAAEGFGTTVKVNSPVAKIKVTSGAVTGVVTDSGEEFDAPLIVTACHPAITFLRQIDPGELPADFVRDIENFRTRSGTVKINVALSRIPDMRGGIGDITKGSSVMIAHSVRYLEKAFEDARNGRASEGPFSETSFPSYFDKTLAPEGTHVASMFTQWVPKEFADQPQPAELEAYADRLFDIHEDFMPGFKDSVLARQVIGPYEMEHDFNLIGGNIFHGELSVDQLFHMRPAPGYADYRTPLKGLYQASSATHAGGGVTGMPGHHAVREIIKDKKWKKK